MKLETRLNQIQTSFEARAQEVQDLMVFDELILTHAIETLNQLEDKLKRHHKLKNPHLSAQQAIKNLENIKQHGSLKRAYQLMYNQCAVLLVSFFAASMHDLFNVAAGHKLKTDITFKARKHKLTFTLGELSEADFDLSDQVGELVSRKAEISFQDMQSIAKAFEEFVGIKIERDVTVNNIIAVQACRHVIAHSDGTVDGRLLHQLRGADDRTLMLDLKKGDKIQFSEDDIGYAVAEMKSYVNNVKKMCLDA